MKSSGENRSRKRGWMPVAPQLSQITRPRPSQLAQTFSVAFTGNLASTSAYGTTSSGPSSQSCEFHARDLVGFERGAVATVVCGGDGAHLDGDLACGLFVSHLRAHAGHQVSELVHAEPLQIVQSTTIFPVHTTHGCTFCRSSFCFPAFSANAIRPARASAGEQVPPTPMRCSWCHPSGRSRGRPPNRPCGPPRDHVERVGGRQNRRGHDEHRRFYCRQNSENSSNFSSLGIPSLLLGKGCLHGLRYMSLDAQASRSTDEVFRSAAAMGRPAVATSRFATAGCFTAEQLERQTWRPSRSLEAAMGQISNPDDKRSLYERLMEQKDAKQAEWEHRHTFKNQMDHWRWTETRRGLRRPSGEAAAGACGGSAAARGVGAILQAGARGARRPLPAEMHRDGRRIWRAKAQGELRCATRRLQGAEAKRCACCRRSSCSRAAAAVAAAAAGTAVTASPPINLPPASSLPGMEAYSESDDEPSVCLSASSAVVRGP